ncbi:PKD domain-containing protein [Streptomyces sp. TBY4]|uniref:PKD domain-containing protein n=1 Tax=Streptomyces sp. TBY4 TaxID=2962030 RepID=UPI0020B6DDA8|nr:PKD domain-containing protein [Streptomyces sp. TBY4]MCP3753847.1 PKD domain-containing protein [Streptomyces sp. TBY4]
MALIPGLAQAADPAPAAGKGTGLAQPDLNLAAELAKAKGQVSKSFTSAADRTVKAPAAAGAPRAKAAAEPDYEVGLDAGTTSAHGIELVSEVTAPSGQSLTVTIDWGDQSWSESYGTSGSGVEKRPHTYAEVGTYVVTVKVEDLSAGTSVTNKVTVTTMGSEFTPHTPTRLLDTRDGTGARQGKVARNGTARVKVAGAGKIPAGATAVVLNVTVTNTTRAGHITAFPTGFQRPATSNLNFEPGQTVPNLVIVPVGADGKVDLYNSGVGTVDLIADVTGYFTQSAASGYTATNPSRIVDTRDGLGTRKGQVAGYATFSTPVRGYAGVPADATAVALNVTVTNPKDAGHLTVYPGGQVPTASNLNFSGGQTVANAVIVPIGSDGRIRVRNGSWKGTDVIVDVVGYYSPGSQAAYVPFQPIRWLDTRDTASWKHGPLPSGFYIYSKLSTMYPGTKAFAMNTTVTNPKGVGFLAVAPDPNSKEAYAGGWNVPPDNPTSSTLNFTPGKTVPNLVQASTGNHGIVDFFNKSNGSIDLIIDIFGDYEVD